MLEMRFFRFCETDSFVFSRIEMSALCRAERNSLRRVSGALGFSRNIPHSADSHKFESNERPERLFQQASVICDGASATFSHCLSTSSADFCVSQYV